MQRENLPKFADKERAEMRREHVPRRTRGVLLSLQLEYLESLHATTSAAMFAPPPVQLSRAEVAARLEAKIRNAEAARSRAATMVSDGANSLHRHEPRGAISIGKHHIFSKGGKVKVSSPIQAQSPTSPPPPTKSSIFKFVAGEEIEDSPGFPNGFGEHPRLAPEPPKRGTRPPSHFFERRVTGQSLSPESSIPPTPQPKGSPSPIPAKSPKRLLLQARDNATQSHVPTASYTSSVSNAMSNLQIDEESSSPSEGRLAQPRSLSVPAISLSEDIAMMDRPDPARSSSEVSFASAVSKVGFGVASGKTSGPGGDDVAEPVARHSGATAFVRGALQEYSRLEFPQSTGTSCRRATEGDIDKIRLSTEAEDETPWKRRRKEKTRGRMLDITSTETKADGSNMQVFLPPPFYVLNKNLPATPTSIMATPTEMYHVIPPLSGRPVVRSPKSRNKKRSPLATISTTHAKANSFVQQKEDISPNRLSAIPELSTLSENSPVSSGMSTPVETQIHLRNGSVVTVSPPETTAWKRSYYIQGAIKLPKPVVVPRKNSMASLEAFQEAIDQVYQEALNIPRRRSDDAVVDDVCEFFDDFGFDEVSYQGDILGVDEILLDEVKEEPYQDAGGFSTTPPAEDPSPVEKVLAQEIILTMARPSPVPKPPIPPVENAETLRAKGIARLTHGMASHQHHPHATHNGRKDSLTIVKGESAVLPVLPIPEESMLEAVLEPSRPENDVSMVDRAGDQSGFEWDDDVEELDGHTHWLGPAVFARRRRGSKGHHRRVPSTTPMQRMKELVFL